MARDDRRVIVSTTGISSNKRTKLNDRFKIIEETRKARQSSDRFSNVMKRRTGQKPKVSLIQEFSRSRRETGGRRRRTGAAIRESISKRLGNGGKKNVPIVARLGNIDIKRRLSNLKRGNNSRNRNGNRGRGNSNRGGRGGRTNMNGQKRTGPKSKEDLDKELDNYMFQNKEVAQAQLDADLDTYMEDRADDQDKNVNANNGMTSNNVSVSGAASGANGMEQMQAA